MDKLPKAAREYLAFLERKAARASVWFRPAPIETTQYSSTSFAAAMKAATRPGGSQGVKAALSFQLSVQTLSAD